MGVYPSTHKTLLSRIQEGDEISWKEFYDRYAPAVARICTNFGLSQSECDDVQQNVMLKIFQNKLIFSYKEEKSRFRTFFNQIVRSCIIDYRRGTSKRDQEHSVDKIPDVVDPNWKEDVFDEEWKNQRLEEALDLLRERVEPRTFLAFQMLVFDGKTVSETADFLKITPSQIYLAKSRCAAKLKQIVDDLGKEDPDLDFKWDCR